MAEKATDASGSIKDSSASGLSIQKLEQLASVTPSFPSPSSSFVPPPMDDADDFIKKTTTIVAARRRDTSVSQHLNGYSPAASTTEPAKGEPLTPSSKSATPTANSSSVGEAVSPESKAVVGEGKVAGRGRPISDPYGDRENHNMANGLPSPEGVGSTSQVTATRTKHLSTPPPLSGNPHNQFLSMTLPSPQEPTVASSGGLSPTPQNSPFFSMIPDSKRNSLASNRRAPVSPTPSRHSSMLPSRRGSKRMSAARQSSTAGADRPSPQRKATSTVLMKIRDFAFTAEDERHSSIKKIHLRDNPRKSDTGMSPRSSTASGSAYSSDQARKSGGGWSSFFQASAARFGFGTGNDAYDGDSGSGSKRNSRLSGIIPLGGKQQSTQVYDSPMDDSDPSSQRWRTSSSSQEEEYSDAQPGAMSESDYDDEPEAPFVPGFYKALYSFEPEGAAEMALEEEQVVRCLGRGGGPGWIIAIKEAKDGVSEQGHALVPEGYLEFMRAFDAGVTDQSGLTPRTGTSLTAA
ncbi:hypothetical protein FRB94_011658 [Tulasnella sp. JGI-2019a]|nr:hypothetical protein FRB94_011658 [Tulasnella sp. JGI-2019a]